MRAQKSFSFVFLFILLLTFHLISSTGGIDPSLCRHGMKYDGKNGTLNNSRTHAHVYLCGSEREKSLFSSIHPSFIYLLLSFRFLLSQPAVCLHMKFVYLPPAFVLYSRKHAKSTSGAPRTTPSRLHRGNGIFLYYSSSSPRGNYP